MAKFKFRLQGYLNIKEKLEEQKKLDYGKALKTLEEEKVKKAKLQTSKNETLQAFKKGVGNDGFIRPNEIQNYNNYIKATNERIKKQEQVVKEAGDQAEQKRKLLVEAVKDRKALDVLKEKALSDYMIEENKAEQKVIDEIVSYKYNK